MLPTDHDNGISSSIINFSDCITSQRKESILSALVLSINAIKLFKPARVLSKSALYGNEWTFTAIGQQHHRHHQYQQHHAHRLHCVCSPFQLILNDRMYTANLMASDQMIYCVQ